MIRQPRFLFARTAAMRSFLHRHAATAVRYDGSQLNRELKDMISAPPFLQLLNAAQERFYPRYAKLRADRKATHESIRQQAEAGELDFRADTAWIRRGDWTVAPIPPVLQHRPVELTGPADNASMMINAFNAVSAEQAVIPNPNPRLPLVKYMPDSEDSSVPTLLAELKGIRNLREALRGTLSFEKEVDGSVKRYSLKPEIAYPIYRVPGIHIDEATMVDQHDRPIPSHLLMTLLYQYHIAPLMRQRGWTGSLYQPKLQSYEEACLVADVLEFSEQHLGLPLKETRVTCLIETLPGTLQAEEIAYGLRDYLCGLNAGRWDYIFQWIQVLQSKITPNRGMLTMKARHMEAYMDHIRDVCERRGAMFIGGMSALIPHAALGEEVRRKVDLDKQHELLHGAQGAWVAHPGMVEQVLRLFTVDKHLYPPKPPRSISAQELVTLEPSLQDVSTRTESGLEQNISVGVQYIAAWLSGRGAVALNGLMEDMATAEISRAQVWQWLAHRVPFTRHDGSQESLTPELFANIFERVTRQLQTENQVPYAQANIPRATELFRSMVLSPQLDNFIIDRAGTFLHREVHQLPASRDLFQPIQFHSTELVGLSPGSRDQGEKLVRTRTAYFRELFRQPTKDGHPRQFWFAGTSNPLVGAATVLGGGGLVGSYLGGWDANAMSNSLDKRLPDTLNVWVEDASRGAKAINNHLRRDMEIENLEYYSQLARATVAERQKIQVPFPWLSVPQLVDLEQGWRSIHHTHLAVDGAIDHGINFAHIEDQGYHKRCGHLGDKELAPFDSYCQILQAANLAATLRLGSAQMNGQGMIFVARTDAYSAKRIEFAKQLSDPRHPDHPFIDFSRGISPDGKYYYLKQGLHPVTNRPYGLELAITRMAEVVRRGLAEYVWMETPNADLHVAKAFFDGVNEKLVGQGWPAKMLYNHSPSFDWDLGFVKGAQPLGDEVISYVRTHIAPFLHQDRSPRGDMHREQLQVAVEMLRAFVRQRGDPVQRDFDFSTEMLQSLLLNALDANADSAEAATCKQAIYELTCAFPSYRGQQALEGLQKPVDRQESTRNVYQTIADARLGLFGKASAACGVELPLTTLPDFHYQALAAHRLAGELTTSSMEAYVKQVQRPERMHFEKHKGSGQPYPYYRHQESTGTGVDAHFAKILGSTDVNALEESTESDDLRDREQLESSMVA